MDYTGTDRRHDTRFLPPLLRLTRATVRPGHPVALIDLSASGALIEGTRPLRPGGRAHLQLSTDARTVWMNGHVLRCAVWALDAQVGVRYRSAVKFDHPCDLFWEAGTLAGSVVPERRGVPVPGTGKLLPVGLSALAVPHRRPAK